MLQGSPQRLFQEVVPAFFIEAPVVVETGDQHPCWDLSPPVFGLSHQPQTRLWNGPAHPGFAIPGAGLRRVSSPTARLHALLRSKMGAAKEDLERQD